MFSFHLVEDETKLKIPSEIKPPFSYVKWKDKSPRKVTHQIKVIEKTERYQKNTYQAYPKV